MNSKTVIWSIVGSVTTLVVTGLVAVFVAASPVSYKQATGKIVSITSGQNVKSIAKELKTDGLIRSETAFYLYARATKKSHKLRAGSFLLYPHQSLRSLVHDLTQKNGVAEMVRITIPEGYAIQQIADLLAEKKLVSAEAFRAYAHHQAKADFQENMPFLKGNPVDTVEGYLFPETYYFPKRAATPKQVTGILLKEFQKRIVPLWEAAEASPGSPKQRFSFHHVLTVASLIEKEARKKEEMPTISAVFYNRLQKRMPLASDPTIVYALGQGYKQKVYYKDLKIDSPYNTYKYSGFPPSPIAAIGVDAFKASLNPEDSDYLFFVANPDGTHTFTKTYRDHLKVQGY